MEIFAVAMGFFSVALAAVGIIFAINLNKRTDRLIQTEDARAKEIIERGDERVERMIQETQKMIKEERKETKELIRYISSLIAADGEKTRELIRTLR